MKNKKRQSSNILILERRCIVSLGAMLFILAGLYVYFVMFSVSHVVAREEFISQGEKLAEQVSEVEREYLTHSRSLTEVYAHSLGFFEVASKSFVERSTVASVSNTLSNAC